MSSRVTSKFVALLVVALASAHLAGGPALATDSVPGLTTSSVESAAPSIRVNGASADDLEAKLSEVFRIDISAIDVTYDFWPERSHFDGTAVMTFRMRPGQTKPVFHFDPWVGNESVRDTFQSILLDGESLDADDPDDIRRHRVATSQQRAFEIQRDVSAGDDHTLEISWSGLNQFLRKNYPGWFYTNVNDIPGRGNEKLFPTINSPEELARHQIQVRVHSDADYTMIGSGVVEETQDGDIQVWKLDTLREISSYIVMFALAPVDEVTTRSFEVAGVPVTIMSDRDESVIDRAQTITENTLPNLIDDFGAFPMPEMHILLIGWGDGMEYYGATRTGIGALRHELVHMYWGTSAINRTWRDTWFDEAATVWWLGQNRLTPPPPGFESDIVSGRSVVRIGFDDRAYGVGAKIIAGIAEAMGGNDEMIEFLADLHARRAFEPFTTDDLIADIHAATGDDALVAHLQEWLFADITRCGGRIATIIGTPGDDVLVGSPGVDVIHGLGGDDSIQGFGERDFICGGGGDDVVDGGPGQDRIYGATGADTLGGGIGSDRIHGGTGADRLVGSYGSDRLWGNGGDDILLGNQGNDVVDGGSGTDQCEGGKDSDKLRRCEATVPH